MGRKPSAKKKNKIENEMENKSFNIDDPQNVNSFLALIGGSQVSSLSERTRSAAPTTVKPEMLSDTLGVSFCHRSSLSSQELLKQYSIKTMMS